jgi:hypothetical protein
MAIVELTSTLESIMWMKNNLPLPFVRNSSLRVAYVFYLVFLTMYLYRPCRIRLDDYLGFMKVS